MKNKNVVIIGGGASGVASAIDLLQAGFKVTIIESEQRLGGLAYAFKKNDKYFHTGYHQILESDTPLLELFKLVNLYDNITWKKCANVISFDGKIYDLMKLKDFIKFPLSFGSKLKFIKFMAICYLKKDWKTLEQYSADLWIRQIAGNEVLEKLFEPLFDIKFGLKASEVSATWVGSRLGAREASCRFGCIPGKEWTTELFAAAEHYLKANGALILLNTKVAKIIKNEKNEISSVDTSAGVIETNIVISTVSPIILNKLIPLNDQLLNKIEYIDSISTIISTPNTEQDLYWVMLMKPRMFSGGIFNLTNLNPTLGNNGEIILNFFTNVEHNSKLLHMSEEELIKSYQETYYKLYGVELAINWYKVNKIPFVSAKYVKGYQNPPARTKVTGLYLSGNYMSYPSVTSTGTAITTGKQTAKVIIDDFFN